MQESAKIPTGSDQNVGAFTARSTKPAFTLYETDASADAKGWSIQAESGAFTLSHLNDAGTSGGSFFSAYRSGNAISRLALLGNGAGNVVIGSYTEPGTGRLQLASHTTSAGGIGFGADVSVYRSAATTLTFTSNIVFSSDNTYSIGNPGGNRPSAVHIHGSGKIQWGNDTSLQRGSAAGCLLAADNLGTSFDRLQFGGTSASYPALKRNSTILQAVLANDTAFTSFGAGDFIANNAATAVGAGKISYGGTTASTVGAAGGASALPATPLGYIIANVAGTQAKIPYYNN